MPARKVWTERLIRSRYFFVAVLIHLVLFAMVATLIVFRAPITPSNDAEFHSVAIKVPPPPAMPPSSGAAANNPQMELQPVTAPVVTPPSIISTTATATFNVDASKALTQALSHLNDQMATGTGLGVGAGSGSGQGSSFFGSSAQGPTPGFEGTFYDFTRTQDGKAIAVNQAIYATIIRTFCKTWKAPEGYPHFKSDITLYSKFFFFPPIADTQAGKAFKTPSSSEAFWIAHYHGSFTPDASGEFRLVGFGDNLLAVRINDRVVLDASDYGFLGIPRRSVGLISLPGKAPSTPLFVGESFVVQPGRSIHLDVVVGDQGGIFCAGLFLAPKDYTPKLSDKGVPFLPLFGVGQFSEDDRKMLGKYLPPEAFKSPITLAIVPDSSSEL